MNGFFRAQTGINC